ncbi:SRPBCC domain-containing protein [Micromonospora zamorensis]|uniref:SRPBCC domain-containing protein n=1 Tax=Micromonospora zamorensis TaxID=709883 RepID=UPI0033A9DC0A
MTSSLASTTCCRSRSPKPCSSPGSAGTSTTGGVDGSECRWARILAFEPPTRVVFSWDIGPTWQLETELGLTSEVEVTFVVETPDQTRVELEHRHLDRHGPGWESVRDGVEDEAGWPLYLDRYHSLLQG